MLKSHASFGCFVQCVAGNGQVPRSHCCVLSRDSSNQHWNVVQVSVTQSCQSPCFHQCTLVHFRLTTPYIPKEHNSAGLAWDFQSVKTAHGWLLFLRQRAQPNTLCSSRSYPSPLRRLQHLTNLPPKVRHWEKDKLILQRWQYTATRVHRTSSQP